MTLNPLEQGIAAELDLAESSRSDGPAGLGDAGLPFDASAVPAYEVRLRSLHAAIVGVEAVEG